jgi:hypothetical protein
MQKILSAIKHELFEIIPPTIFFFVAFNVIAFSKRLMLEQYGIKFSGFVASTVGAIIVAKVVLIADKIPVMNKYPDKPLIYNVVWKTAIYVVVALVVRFLEYLIPLWWTHGNLSLAVEHLWGEIIWAHFWVIQIWLVCLFFVYVSFRELARTLGEEQFFKMFLGIQKSTHKTH